VVKYLQKQQVFLIQTTFFCRKWITSGKCYVTFKIVATRDELLIGVTNQPEVRKLSAYGNLNRTDTWVYSKSSVHFGMVCFGTTKIVGENNFVEGDDVTIYVDADEQEVCWYRNGKFIATNLPNFPLQPSTDGYGIYVQVDEVKDRVEILDFGYCVPFEKKPEDVKMWEDTFSGKAKKELLTTRALFPIQ